MLYIYDSYSHVYLYLFTDFGFKLSDSDSTLMQEFLNHLRLEMTYTIFFCVVDIGEES